MESWSSSVEDEETSTRRVLSLVPCWPIFAVGFHYALGEWPRGQVADFCGHIGLPDSSVEWKNVWSLSKLLCTKVYYYIWRISLSRRLHVGRNIFAGRCITRALTYITVELVGCSDPAPLRRVTLWGNRHRVNAQPYRYFKPRRGMTRWAGFFR